MTDWQGNGHKNYTNNPTLEGALKLHLSTPVSSVQKAADLLGASLEGLVPDIELLARAKGIIKNDIEFHNHMSGPDVTLSVGSVPHEITGQLAALSKKAGEPLAHANEHSSRFSITLMEGGENSVPEKVHMLGKGLTALRREIDDAIIAEKGRQWMEETRREIFLEKIIKILNRTDVAKPILKAAAGIERKEFPELFSEAVGRSPSLMGEQRMQTEQQLNLFDVAQPACDTEGHVARITSERRGLPKSPATDAPATATWVQQQKHREDPTFNEHQQAAERL